MHVYVLQEGMGIRKNAPLLHGCIVPLQPETASSQPGWLPHFYSFIYKVRNLIWFDNKLHLCTVESSDR